MARMHDAYRKATTVSSLQEIGFNGGFSHTIFAEREFHGRFWSWHNSRYPMGPDGADMNQLIGFAPKRISQLRAAG